MALYPYVATLAVDPVTLVKAAGATGVIYAPEDTSFASPLTATDATGNPIPLKANADGILPSFYATAPAVNWRSGSYTFPLVTSQPLPGEPGQPGTPGADGAPGTPGKDGSNVVPTEQAIAGSVALAAYAGNLPIENAARAGYGLPKNTGAASIIRGGSAAEVSVSGAAEIAASDNSPNMTFTAGGAYVNDGNEGRWGATFNKSTTGLMGVIFQTTAPWVGIRLRSWAGHRYQIKVNGQYVTPKTGTPGPANGSIFWLRVNLPAGGGTVKLTHAGGQIYSIHVPTGHTATRVNPVGPRVAVIGDSYTGGSGAPPTGYTALSGWVQTMADILGWDDVIAGGIGGSGWIAKGAANANFEDRVPDIISWAPSVVVFAGGQNDASQTNTNVGAAVSRTLAALRAGLPSATIITTGGFHVGSPVDGSPDPYWTLQQNAILNAAASYGPTIRTTDRALFTGTGRAGTPGTGNGERYIQSDWIHPTQAGADYLGHWMASEITKLAVLQPADLTGHTTVVPPTTPTTPTGPTVVFSDDFNRANATTIGSPTVGPSWAQQGTGTAVIDNNTAGFSTASGNVYMTSTGQANGTLEFKLATAGNKAGCFVFRFTNTQLTLVLKLNGSNWGFFKRESGPENLIADLGVPYATGDLLKIVLNGTTVTISVNGTQAYTGTVADNATSTGFGFRDSSATGTTRWDDVKFTSL